MWPYPWTHMGTLSQQDTWTCWHLQERLKGHLNYGCGRDSTSPP